MAMMAKSVRSIAVTHPSERARKAEKVWPDWHVLRRCSRRRPSGQTYRGKHRRNGTSRCARTIGSREEDVQRVQHRPMWARPIHATRRTPLERSGYDMSSDAAGAPAWS